MTIEDVEGQPLDYWINEIRSSTWVVAQRGKEIVGLVAGKLPAPADDPEDQAFTQYIESAWITPEFRRKGLGKRLIHYLIEIEYRKNQKIRKFLVWVFATNDPAIKVFEHQGFRATRESKLLRRMGHSKDEVEVKYCLDFDAVVHATQEDARRQDRRLNGVTYRVLGTVIQLARKDRPPRLRSALPAVAPTPRDGGAGLRRPIGLCIGSGVRRRYSGSSRHFPHCHGQWDGHRTSDGI